MHEKFWKNKYVVDGVAFTLNDIKRIEFDCENYKCYFVFNDEGFKLEVSKEDAILAIESNLLWRPLEIS